MPRTAYREQQERAQQAVAVAKHADDKATRAETDRLEKGKPYEADCLFMYLWNRRFLTPDYRGGWFTRPLDNWVANIIDFQRNRSNYYCSWNCPADSVSMPPKSSRRPSCRCRRCRPWSGKRPKQMAFWPCRPESRQPKNSSKQLDADIETEETRHQTLLAEEAEFNAGTDPLSKQIIDLQSAALAKEPLPSLYQKARTTLRPEDDVIVAKIHQLRQRQEQLTEEIKSLNTILQEQQRNMGELEEVRRRYRQRGYDCYDSRFPGDFALAVLLGRMLDGLANPDTVWGEIDRQHQSRGPEGGWGGWGAILAARRGYRRRLWRRRR